MESDWQRRGHPHDTAPAPSTVLPTLPSVAELIASSRPAPASIPAYHHAASPLPPILSSTPHNPPPTAAANAPSPAEQSYLGAARYSSHARSVSRYQGVVCGTRAHVPYSPTNSATSATSASGERHFYPPPTAAQGPTPGPSFEGYPCSEDPAHQASNSARRQDSAIAHHHYRIESSKEGPPLAPPPPSEPDAFYSHRSPTISRPSTSPAPRSHHSSQSPAQVPSNLHVSTRPEEHVTGSTATSHYQPALDPSPKSLSSPLPQDHPNTSNTRQQRYNVRFATNYTSENMPSVQRPRPSPPLPATAPAVETTRPLPSPQSEHVAPTIDPLVRSILMGTNPHPDAQSQAESEAQESKVERCPGCNEAWSRKPVHALEWGKQSPATSVHDLEKAQGDTVSRLRQLEKDNDEAFDLWKKKHSQCPVPPTAPSRNVTSNGLSNKRKSEGPHPFRKVTFDSHGPPAPLPQPSAPI
jgi:hypothetical protein